MLTFSPVAEEQQLPLIEIDPLFAVIEGLKLLRSSIVAKAEVLGDRKTQKVERTQINTDLTVLRAMYMNKVDEIAMQHGVAEALKIKKQVEDEISESKR